MRCKVLGTCQTFFRSLVTSTRSRFLCITYYRFDENGIMNRIPARESLINRDAGSIKERGMRRIVDKTS